MRTSNPALREGTFSNLPHALGTDAMTVHGTVNKTAILLAFVTVSAGYTWYLASTGYASLAHIFAIIGAFAGFITVLIAVFNKPWSPVLAPLYAVLEGFTLGSISFIFESRFPGIVIQAVGLTFGTTAGLLLAYQSGVIKVTENFKLGLFAATLGIGLYYLAALILSHFNITAPLIWENGPLGIAFSLIVVGVAALNLVLDFDFIENGEKSGAPKYMEWYAALGLMVTLVWLYVEFLRLLSKARSRR